jgi:hypothetical protein
MLAPGLRPFADARGRRSPYSERMYRFGLDLLVTITASTIMLAGVLLAGSAVAQPAPRAATWPIDDGSACRELPVTALAASTVEGQARLCLDDGAVRAGLQVSGLSPGQAYTAWLAYFDRPADCGQAPCGLVDLLGENPPGVLGRVGGGVPNYTRAMELHAELHDLMLTPGAQVSLLLLNHGSASIVDARARARQILTAETSDFDNLVFGTAADGRKAFPHAQAVFTIR